MSATDLHLEKSPAANGLGSPSCSTIADADGVRITKGSVLRHVTEDDRGVVVHITTPDQKYGFMCEAVGDIRIQSRPGCYRCTNIYKNWRHIPHNEQTYKERFLSWMCRPYDHDAQFSRVSKDEGQAISGIMALLPDDIVDWDYGPFPDRIEDALGYLVEHLSNSEINQPQLH